MSMGMSDCFCFEFVYTFYTYSGGFRDQADGGRPENRHLKGCLTEIFLLQIESISLGMLKNGSG
jgi:hypothetical protein